MSCTQVYLDDLPLNVDEEFFRSLFQECGTIPPNGIVIKKHKCMPKCFAFITFQTREAAQKALDEINYTKLDGVPLRMWWADPETLRIRKFGTGSLYIRGLEESIEPSQLHDAFQDFGEIITCMVKMKNGESLGCGFIQFRNPEDAERARIELQAASINDKIIRLDTNKSLALNSKLKEEFYRKFPEKTKEHSLFVSNIPLDASDDEFREFFSEFGEIEDFMIAKETTPPFKSEGIGYVLYKEKESAEKAIQETTFEPFKNQLLDVS